MKHIHYISHNDLNNHTNSVYTAQFSEQIVQFIQEDNNYPIIEAIDGFQIFVLLLPIYTDDQTTITLIECDLIINSETILLITNEYHPQIQQMIVSIQHNKKHTPLLYKFLIEVCSSILMTIISLEKIIEQMKQSTINETGYTEDIINTIMKLKLNIGMFKSTIIPLTDIIMHIFETISYTHPTSKENNRNQLQYLLKQISSQSNFLYENISIVADTSNAIQNIKANSIMKILTIISSVFIPLSFVTGFFGMNFTHLPIDQATIYYATVIGMIFIGSLQLYVFKRKKRF